MRTFLVRDESDLVDCHARVVEALAYLHHECGLERQQVRIDYTGGTKTMSAAAVLAAAPDGYRFIYVAGEMRDKNGLGVVTAGRERIAFPDNPWSVLEEPELRSLLAYAGVGQWPAALDVCGRLLARADESSRPVFKTLQGMLEGLRLWDGFDHQGATKEWEKSSPLKVRDLARVSGRVIIAQFALKCVRMTPALKCVGECLHSPPGKGPDPLVLDLLGNADRCAARGWLDEAALRCYRAVELCAQRRLKERFGIDTDAVKPEAVPDPLKSDLLGRYGASAGQTWQLGLRDSAELLNLLGDPVGGSLAAALPKLDISARNKNWLIHGWQHVSRKQLEAFWRNTLAALGVKEEEVPRWPDFTP